MNITPTLKLPGVVACILVFSSANASIIIDYDDGLANGVHDAVVNDGGFESFTSAQPAKFNQDSAAGNFLAGFGTGVNSGWLNLSELPNSFEDIGAADNRNVRTGAMAGYFASNIGQLHGLATGYTIQSGDSFTGSFYYRIAANAEADDVLRITLFTVAEDALDNFSNLSNETVTNLYTYTMPSDATTTYQQYSFSSGIVAESAVGMKLMFSIEKVGFTGDGGVNEFARIDDIYLAAVPEPATFALLAGIATLGLVMYRRRKAQF